MLDGTHGDKTLTAKWQAIVYDITYEYDDTIGDVAEGDALKESYTIEDDFDFISLECFTEGYHFAGWYTEKDLGTGEQVTGVELGTIGDITVYAHWGLEVYDITYIGADGVTSTNPVNYTIESETFTIAALTKVGYTFDGWFEDDACEVVADTTIETGTTGDLVFYASWTPIEYTIEYNLYGGGYSGEASPGTYTIETGAELVDPVLDGSFFVGWYDAAEGGALVTSIEVGEVGNKTLYARWLTFDSEGGSEITGGVSYSADGVTEPQAPTLDWYDFGGWYLDETFEDEYDFALPSTSMTVHALWIPTEYEIEYVLGGGENAPSNPATYNVEDEVVFADASREGYTFNGWYGNAQFTTEQVTGIAKGSHGKVTVFASFSINQYTISFETGGGTTVSEITQDYGTAVSAPAQPSKTGYEFVGWYESDPSELYDFTTMPARDFTLYAAWELVTYDIVYNLDGGVNGANPSGYTIESATIELADATKRGYEFVGWFSDSGLGVEVTSIEAGSYGDVELFAGWEVIEYDITYHLPDGATHSNPDFYTVETDITSFEDGVKTGYTFDGWFADADLEQRVTSYGGGAIGAIELWAGFTANEYTVWLDGKEQAAYTIDFDLGGAEGNVPAQVVTAEVGLTVPEAPQWEGRVFAGWYDNAECEGLPYDFSGTVTTSRTLYAKWVVPQGTPVAVGGEYSAAIDGTAMHKVSVVPLVSGNVTLTTTGSIDTIAWLYDAEGNLLKANDDGGADGSNFLIVYNMAAGQEYVLEFRGYSRAASGTATLTVAGRTEAADGGTASDVSGSKVVTFDGEFTLPVPAERDNWIFRGWADEDGVMYTDATGAGIRVWDKAEETVLVSVWEADGFNITFVTNGGSAVETVTIPHGGRVDINSYVTTRSGYSFLGWYLSASDSEPYNASVMPDYDITLYAKWTAYALNAIKFDESMKAISALRDVTAEDFGATCFDTDGNIIAIAVTISGELDAGQTVTARLTASANGKTKTATITDVKVYGLPTLDFDDQIDYFNLVEGLSADWFAAVGTDTYGEPTAINVYIEGEYGAGDIVTVTIAAVDVAGNIEYGYIHDVKVYGTPEIQYNEQAELSFSYDGSQSALGATATDSFGKELVVNTFIVNKLYVNQEYRFTSSGYYRQDKEALFFDVEEDGTYTFYHDKRNSGSSWATTFVVYNVTDGTIVKSVSNSGLWSKSFEFDVKANKTYCIKIGDENRLNYASATVTIYLENSNGEKVKWYRLGSYMNRFSGYTTTDGEQIAYFSANDTTNYNLYVSVGARSVIKIYDYTDNTTAYSNTSFTGSKNIAFKVTQGHTYQIAIRPYGGETDNRGNFTVTVSDGTRSIGLYNAIYPLDDKNNAQIGQSTSTYDYVYFMPLKDEELTFYCQTRTSGGSSTYYASFILYNLTTGSTIKSFNNISYSSGIKSITFSAKAGEIYRIRISANNAYLSYSTYVTKSDGSYVVCYNDKLTFGSLIAGRSTMITMLAIDSKGNMTRFKVEAKVYGLPTISEPEHVDFRVSEEITPSSLGVVAQDSYDNELDVELQLQSGEHKAGQILTYLISAVDSVGNVATKAIEVKLYGDIIAEYGLEGATEKSLTADDLQVKAYDSFNNKLDVKVTLVQGSLIAGQTVTFNIHAVDLAGNIYNFDREYRVYSVDDIQLEYNAWLTDKIKLTSKGEEFEAVATDTYGENCITTIEAVEGYDLVGGNTISLYIVATDKAGNIKKSEIISDIRIYDMPTASLTDEEKGYFINENEDISFLFTVSDSFGEELYAEITSDVEPVGGSYVNINVKAVDDAGNLFEEVYQFRVLTTNAFDVDLYVDGTLWESSSVVDGTDYVLPMPENYQGESYCWADENYFSYTTTDGKNIRELSSYTKLYLCNAISSVEDLQTITLDGKYSLVCNLDLQGAEWTPLGTNQVRFTGLFNGSDFTISNFTIKSGSTVGFFAYNSGTILNLTVADYVINTQASSGTVGGLVAYNYGIIKNSSVEGTITITPSTSNSHIGGLVGENNGEIYRSYSSGSISVTSRIPNSVGGLVGTNYKIIENCHSDASVSSTSGISFGTSSKPYSYAGGLVGRNSGNISTCYATGSVLSSSLNQASYTTSAYSAVSYAGGLIGYNTNSVSNCYATGSVSASSRMRFDYHSPQATSHFTKSYAGGLIGYNTSNITNCYALGDVTANSEFTWAYLTGDCSDAGPHASYAGGLVGYNASSRTISNCFAMGNVTASSTYIDVTTTALSYAGGVVGLNDGTITNCSRYSGQKFSVIVAETSKTSATNSLGTSRTLTVLQSSNFYINTLKWDMDVWNIVEGEYPTLK